MKGIHAMYRMIAASALLLSAFAASATGQDGISVRPAVAAVPFGPGEQMRYKLSAKYGVISGGGEGSLSVESVETVHGFRAYVLAMRMKGKVVFWKMDDVQRSWMDVQGLFARRFEQKLNQTSYNRDKTLDFYPDEMRWQRVRIDSAGNAHDTEEKGNLATSEPLDDVSFLYHLRTMPLEVGQTYTVPRYYKADGNPVRVTVVRKERIKVPAGEYETVVIHPVIKAKGLFAEGGEAEVWLSDDDRRMLIKLKAKVSVGTLNMELVSYTAGTPLSGEAAVGRPQ
jgi:hypothetical protein